MVAAMAALAIPILFCLFAWWFSTGILIYLNHLPQKTFPWAVAVATALLPVSVGGVYAFHGTQTATAAYLSFLCGLFAWGWTQLTFYTGMLTGPRRERCAEGCHGLIHFWHAVETCLYNEIAALALGAALFAAAWDGSNWTGAWTYGVLWIMHASAKMNAVLGVRNLNEEFFPPHLKYLRGFLRAAPINLLFPLSVTGGTIAAAFMLRDAGLGSNPFRVVSSALPAAMMALAVIEHWLLILPIPAAQLWTWGLKSAQRDENGVAPEQTARHLTITPRPTKQTLASQPGLG